MSSVGERLLSPHARGIFQVGIVPPNRLREFDDVSGLRDLVHTGQESEILSLELESINW